MAQENKNSKYLSQFNVSEVVKSRNASVYESYKLPENRDEMARNSKNFCHVTNEKIQNISVVSKFQKLVQ